MEYCKYFGENKNIITNYVQSQQLLFGITMTKTYGLRSCKPDITANGKPIRK